MFIQQLINHGLQDVRPEFKPHTRNMDEMKILGSKPEEGLFVCICGHGINCRVLSILSIININSIKALCGLVIGLLIPKKIGCRCMIYNIVSKILQSIKNTYIKAYKFFIIIF